MSSTATSPKLSVVVIAYDMPTQAMNTLYSLCSDYQRGVSAEQYEVIVVENRSANMLDEAAVRSLPGQFSYYRREEAGVSPAPAINAGLAACRGQYLGLLIDGARMLSPGVLRYALQGLAVPASLVAVPGYYLTEAGRAAEGITHDDPAALLANEQALLQANNWQNQGYKLFEQAVFSNGNSRGFCNPMMECNALFCERAAMDAIGGADLRFTLSGGGSLNLHLYRQLALAASRLFVLPGEGNFHQFHGGASTTAGAARDARVKAFNEQLNSFWPGGFRGITREPWLLGTVPDEALDMLQRACDNAGQRFARLGGNDADAWQDETAATGNHGGAL